MSATDIERFVADLKGNASLLDEAKGVSGGLAAMVTFADSKGYGITVDEAKAYISDKANAELSDDQLDAVAGGKTHHSSVSTSTTIATSTVVAANVSDAAEIEVAIAVGAVVAVVLT